MFYFSINSARGGRDLQVVNFFSERLQTFISSLLVFLDQRLDRWLVSTFAGLCQSIIRLRSRATGLYLSELGSYLLSPAKAPAGTKRISNLLRSSKWQEHQIYSPAGEGLRPAPAAHLPNSRSMCRAYGG